MTKKTTEQSSLYNDLEKMSTFELLTNINNEDKKVPTAIEKVIPKIENLVDLIVERISDKNGRLFYIGAAPVADWVFWTLGMSSNFWSE